MGPIYTNYFASVVFATLTFILLFIFFRGNGDRVAMLLVIVGTGMAWISCYIGVLAAQLEARIWTYIAVGATAASVLIVFILILFAVRTFIHA